MERRKFLKCSGTACAGLILNAVIGVGVLSSCGVSSAMIKTQSVNGKVTLLLSELQDNKFKIIRVSGADYDIGVQKLDDASYRVLLLLCPHANQPLTKTGDGFLCTLHGSRFSADGAVTKGPSSEPVPTLNYSIVDKNMIIDYIVKKF